MRWARLGAAAGAALLAAQIVRPARTNPPVTRDVDAPPAVRELLRRACYDCHSNETRWPWYSGVAPASWLVAHDVSEARRKLNFSTWDAYEPAKRTKRLREAAEEIQDDGMPLWYYRPFHAEARLAPAERDLLRAWALVEAERLDR